LVVQEDRAVRDVTCSALEALGYTILRAMNGREALGVARANRGRPIRLVITDVGLTQLVGDAEAEWREAARADFKILVTFGHADDAIVPHGSLAARMAFLANPSKVALLAYKVRAMLDA